MRLTAAGAADSIGAVGRWAWADHPREVSVMSWETPEFIEVKMDAEINSYQDDFDREPDDRF
jgi:coenzyme PQQ precursor peptide PqqA